MFYKAFNDNLTCRDFQYEIGKTYTLPSDTPLIMCRSGFHACKKLEDCFYYYSFDSRLCKVQLGQNQITEEDKTVSDTITIVEEVFLNGCIEHHWNKAWYKNGKLHREDGPAVIYNDRVKKSWQEWWKNGKRHRDNDLPAIIFSDGGKKWYRNGELHRDGDKPAIINSDGTKKWWKNGERHRDGDLPAVISSDGTKEWYKNGKQHRDGDRPAFIRSDGTKAWYKNGEPHRDDDLPAVILSDRTKLWYKNGKEYNKR